jgi:hypothetical protein
MFDPNGSDRLRLAKITGAELFSFVRAAEKKT